MRSEKLWLVLAGAVLWLAPAQAQLPASISFGPPGMSSMQGNAAGFAVPSPGGGLARQGMATEAEAGASIVRPLGEAPRASGGTMAVFGAAIFTGQAATASDAPNPNYVLAIGDRITVRVWGAVDAELIGMVDPQGNVFIPNVGPVRVAGVRAGDLQRVIEGELRRIYTQQVQVYAALASAQRIGVFVTGFVRIPGRFGGTAADSPLDFLVRAGGVDPTRGSYRDIQLLRGGRTVATIDLYRFLLEGRLPPVRMEEGDTILVGRQRALVGGDGAVRNNFLFEVSGRAMAGSELLRLAAPLPSATNAVIRGTRNGRPFARYVTVRELGSAQLLDQDTVSFITDAPAQTVRVSIEGSRIGPSVLIADRDTSLCTLLDHVEVDPQLANPRGVFLLRPGLAAQQTRTINEAMDRLERQLFLSISPTTGVAEVRASEANLVANYIQRARRTQPEGRLVVMDRAGRCADVRLQDGDTIVVPERVQTVLVSGEVRAPQAVVWRPNLRIPDYIGSAGGFAERGVDTQVMIRKASGELILEPTEGPEPGDELIALPRLDPKNFQLARDLLNLIFQSALSARVFMN